MVLVKQIKADQFIKIGFKTKKEAIKFIDENKIISNKNETEKNYLGRLKNERINYNKTQKFVKKYFTEIKKQEKINKKIISLENEENEQRQQIIKNELNKINNIVESINEIKKGINNIDELRTKLLKSFNKLDDDDYFDDIKYYYKDIYNKIKGFPNFYKDYRYDYSDLINEKFYEFGEYINYLLSEIDEYNNLVKQIKKINNINDTPIIYESKTALTRLIKFIYERYGHEKILMKIGDVYYNLNTETAPKLFKQLNEIFEDASEQQKKHKEVEIKGIGSDVEFIEKITDEIKNISFRILKESTKGRKMREPGYFPYYNKSNINLDFCQIMNENDIKNINSKIHDEREEVINKINNNCLVHALKVLQMPDNEIEYLKCYCQNRNIPVSKLQKICEDLNIILSVKHFDNERIRKTIYGKIGKVYNLGVLESHYFADVFVNVSTYYIKNYDKLKDHEHGNLITGIETKGNKKYYKKDKTKQINNTFDIIFEMLKDKQKFFESLPINFIEKTIYSDMEKEIKTLEYLKSNCKPVNKEKKDIEVDETKKQHKKIEYTKIMFIDFETDTTKEEGHQAYLLCAVTDEKDKHPIIKWGKYCAKSFLDTLSENTILIAHNMDYDSRFKIPFLMDLNELSRNNSLMEMTGKYYNNNTKKTIEIKLKCSLKMINMKLSKFPETFKNKNEYNADDDKKEVMPYSFYSFDMFEKYNDGFAPISEALEHIKDDEDKKIFIENIDRWGLKDGNKFNYKEYSIKYCLRDCQILAHGYNKFAEWMQEITDLKIIDFVSLASLSDKYLIKSGCYDGIYQFNGIIKKFMMESVVGGRVMTRRNEKFEINIIVSDFDAVSLYASAMARIYFPKGKPKIIKNNVTYDDIKNYDAYFIEIEINNDAKIKLRDFPLMSEKVDGIRNFTNNIYGKKFIVNNLTLEDLIKFQELKPTDFKILRGYYFNEGKNIKIQEVITKLFNARVEAKKNDNLIEVVYKELMNSAYGKTIMKTTKTDIKYFNNEEDYKNYLSNNFNSVICSKKIKNCEKYRVKIHVPINSQYTRPHCGSLILSMSKRIMNEVMCLAEDNNINIFYQDTDSMHIIKDEIPKLSKLFFEKYGRELIGKKMGQFHTDFKLKGAISESIDSINSVYLGKKSYIDELRGYNKEGKEIKGYHMRMKGITSGSIKHKALSMGLNEYEIYKYLLHSTDGLAFDQEERDENYKPTQIKFIKDFDKSICNMSKPFYRHVNFNKENDYIGSIKNLF